MSDTPTTPSAEEVQAKTTEIHGPDPELDDAPEEQDKGRPADEPEAVLEISTAITPTKLMRIDGEEYKLLNFDHLSPEQEAVVTATFARLQRVFLRLSDAPTQEKAQVEARKMLRYRERMIALMTSIPESVISTLGPMKQGKILEAIREEIGASGSEESDTDDTDDE